ncbi:hypothetical protein [Amycolatopsis sp. DG1A-15b]|uniref:hypothetical protein n=1 Tax=Amycolatopsis sp. DG1A-15b TaxID=3052846 RepID=UPI00255BF54E|nr:hypothetical protein [Amycolatopsis sp. DG1A-15b]WIX92333.1 hypothetical protein QRY02_18550 [Amycolatopsis sp. DG1A-15b]
MSRSVGLPNLDLRQFHPIEDSANFGQRRLAGRSAADWPARKLNAPKSTPTSVSVDLLAKPDPIDVRRLEAELVAMLTRYVSR